MTLTKEEQLAIASGENVSVTVDGIRCVLVRAEVFERVRDLLSADDPRLAYPAILRAWDDGGDPADYEEYRDLA